ncbi:hypothetical protein ACJ2A9_02245 [Anaerobacillus sp. MEB173]|uniref:hypothetical protein n=1 Tax=Anaerobacillus sp. MEB173 TaxID=3383345 RepID=UPI003F900C4C
MKKSIIGLLSLGLVFGIGTTVFGNADVETVVKNEFPSFEEMAPLMQEMHPDWTEKDMETMYQSCHGSE